MDVADRRDTHDRPLLGHRSPPALGKTTYAKKIAGPMLYRQNLCLAGTHFAAIGKDCVVECASRALQMELAPIGLAPRTRAFYVRTLAVLIEAGIPFLVGGAYALAKHAGIERHTKDLDIFVHRHDRDPILHALGAAGYRTDVSFPHWLAKAYDDDDAFVDVIYSSGNGVTEVDDEWFAHAAEGEIL